MLIKIDSDVYDILSRLKEIDDGYFVVYNLNKSRYELHNDKQDFTYCLTVPFDEIDARLIDLVYYSNIANIDNIIEDIDNNNIDNETYNNDIVKNQTKFMTEEIYKFCSNSSKNFDSVNSFDVMWR